MQLSVNHDYKDFVTCVSYVRQLVDSGFRVYATVFLACWRCERLTLYVISW